MCGKDSRSTCQAGRLNETCHFENLSVIQESVTIIINVTRILCYCKQDFIKVELSQSSRRFHLFDIRKQTKRTVHE